VVLASRSILLLSRTMPEEQPKPSYVRGRDQAVWTLASLSILSTALVLFVVTTQGSNIMKGHSSDGKNGTATSPHLFLGATGTEGCLERSVSSCQDWGPVSAGIFRLYAEATWGHQHCLVHPKDCKNTQRRDCPRPPPSKEGEEEWRPLTLYKTVCYYACPPGCKHASFCNCEPCPPGETGRTSYAGKNCAIVYANPGSNAQEEYCADAHVTCPAPPLSAIRQVGDEGIF